MLETLQDAVYCHAVRNSTGRRGRTSAERCLAIPYTHTYYPFYYPLLVYTVAEIRLLVQRFCFFVFGAEDARGSPSAVFPRRFPFLAFLLLAFINHLSSCF